MWITGWHLVITWETFQMSLIWSLKSLWLWTLSSVLFQAPPQAGFVTLSECLNLSELTSLIYTKGHMNTGLTSRCLTRESV